MAEKPPMGIIPKWKIEQDRLRDLQGCIHRYMEAELPLNLEWVTEYNELIKIKR